MKKKTIVLLIVGMFLALSLLGCNGKTSDSPENTTSTKDTPEETTETVEETTDDPVTITWLHHFAEPGIQQWVNHATESFGEEYPNLKVSIEMVSGDDYFQILKTKVASDDAPNIFDLTNLTYYTEFYEAGHLYDISGLECIENIQPDLLPAAQVNGVQCGIPLDMNAYCAFYNKDMFEELGLQVPTTVTEMTNVCETLLAAGITPFACGFQAQWCNSLHYNGYSNTMLIGKNFDWYTDKMSLTSSFSEDADFLKSFELFYNTKKYWGDDPFGTSWDAALDMMATEEAAMIVNGTWTIDGVTSKNPDINVGVLGLPVSENPEDVRITLIPGAGFCVYNATDEDKLDASIKLYNLLYSKESGEYYATTAIKMSSVAGIDYSFSDALGEVQQYIADGKVVNTSGIIDLTTEYSDILYEAVVLYSMEDELDAEGLAATVDNGFLAIGN